MTDNKHDAVHDSNAGIIRIRRLLEIQAVLLWFIACALIVIFTPDNEMRTPVPTPMQVLRSLGF